MKKYYLYYLIDPNTNEVRYIGITYRPEKRLNEHLSLAKKQKTYKDNWILKLAENNQRPILKIISESESKEEIVSMEINGISNFSGLTNATTGGEYFTFTQDVIAKMRLRNSGENNPNYGNTWDEDQKKKQSEKYRNRLLTEEWKSKITLNMPNRKEVIIDGIKYPSISNAAKLLKINYRTAQKFVTK